MSSGRIMVMKKGLVGGDQPGFLPEGPLPERRENGLVGLVLQE
jgi:hypothetical protein